MMAEENKEKGFNKRLKNLNEFNLNYNKKL